MPTSRSIAIRRDSVINELAEEVGGLPAIPRKRGPLMRELLTLEAIRDKFITDADTKTEIMETQQDILEKIGNFLDTKNLRAEWVAYRDKGVDTDDEVKVGLPDDFPNKGVMRRLGIDTLEKAAAVTKEQLMALDNVGEKRSERIMANVWKYLSEDDK